MHLCVADELFNLRVGQSAGSRDLDALLLARAQVFGVDVHDAVGIDVERHFNLRHAARRGRNAHQLKAPQRAVVRGHLALTLQNMDADRRLVVGRR